jgi:hypothetical protein
MDVVDRRSALRSLLCGVVATGLGVGLLPGSAAAMPLAMEKNLGSKTDDFKQEAQAGARRPDIRVAIITGTVAIGTVVIGAVGFAGGIEAVAYAAGGEHPSAVRQGQSVIWRIP